MAPVTQVFGKPVTHGTRTQRALTAKNSQNAGGKLDEVMKVMNQMQKAASGSANRSTASTTIGRIYNATGDVITCVTEYDWEGKVLGHYPIHLKNGQWGVFEHVGTRGPHRKGSIAAAVYNVEDCGHSMIAWNNPWKKAQGGSNTAYCEMNSEDYFDDCDWDEIYENLMGSGNKSQSCMDGYVTKVTIDAGSNTPFYSATLYLNI